MVGEGELSPCFQELKTFTKNVVETPLAVVYNATEKTLATKIVMNLVIKKAPSCVEFNPTSSETIVGETTPTTMTPLSSSPAEVRQDSSSTTSSTTDSSSSTPTASSKGFASVSIAGIFVTAIALIAVL